MLTKERDRMLKGQYDAVLQRECEIAADIMAQDKTVTRAQALREAKLIMEKRA